MKSHFILSGVFMYIKRHIEEVVNKLFTTFPAVLITGPRQVGKSTMLKEKFKSTKYILLDNSTTLSSLKNDSLGFFELMGTPLILDEIQRASECFTNLKYFIDTNKKNGMYILTGSQKYELMKNVSESLAGRVAIVNMLGLSQREINKEKFTIPFLPTKQFLTCERQLKNVDLPKLWERIHTGSMPELYSQKNLDWESFYSSYVSSYIERDVKQLSQIGNELTFMQFMTLLAARTGEIFNMTSIAKEIGVSNNTIKNWISILQASGVIYLLQPFSLNVGKRIIKSPKVYFMDTGLVCYLCRWLTPETLQNGAMAGNIFETYVVSEIIKSYYNAGKEPNIYYFRNTEAQEVDLLFYENGSLHPLEIKKTSSPNLKDIKNFRILQNFYPTLEIGEGGILCCANTLLPLDTKNKIIPINLI